MSISLMDVPFYKALVLLFLFGVLVTKGTTFASVLDSNCEQNTTLPGYGIKVIHSQPFRENGTVILEASLTRQFHLGLDPMCIWTYKVCGIIVVQNIELSYGSSLWWNFRKPGLKKVLVTAQFSHLGREEILKNCTFVNVTDCDLKVKIEVSTSSRTYSVKDSHSNIYMDAPGLVDFKLSILKVDSYFVCKDLHFLWEFGDGQNTSGKHVQHYYNNAGVFSVVMRIFNFIEDLDQRRFLKEITMKIDIEDCPLKSKIMVATSSGSYNISHNHTDVYTDGPGLVKFNLSISKVRPYSICKDLFFFWDFGDGDNATRKHVQHHYNKTGVFTVIMSIFKDYEYPKQRMFISNITMTIHIKVKHASSQNSNAVIDVSLVLAIFFTCFVFVICIAAYWFRKRLHRHTEVARFDFRASELQSGFDYVEGAPCSARVLSGKGCINTVSCRRGSTENLLNFAPNRHYSSCKRFGGKNLHEDL